VDLGIFRPISLTSFLLKTMERLVDRFLRDEVLALQPLHPNQHVYQTGKSVEMALHQIVVRVEKALDQQEIVLDVFLDIEETFDNTFYDTICSALTRHGVDQTIVRWIRATLEGRLATAAFGVSPVVSRCPGAALRWLPPLIWCLVNELLVSLNEGSVMHRDMRITPVFLRWENS